MGLSPYKRVIYFEGDVRNILPEHVRSATVLCMLLKAFDCMRVPCVICTVYVVRNSNTYLYGRQFSLITDKLSFLFYIVKACKNAFVLQTVAFTGMKMCTFSFFLFCAINPT